MYVELHMKEGVEVARTFSELFCNLLSLFGATLWTFEPVHLPHFAPHKESFLLKVEKLIQLLVPPCVTFCGRYI